MFSITINGPNQADRAPTLQIPCSLGRQPNSANPEITIADPFVSRRHIELESAALPDELTIRCVGSSPVIVVNGETISPGESATVQMPAELLLGRSRVMIEPLNPGVSFLRPAATLLSGGSPLTEETLGLARDENVAPEKLVDWFERLVLLQGAVTGVNGYFEQAAKAVVELIGLDRCVVIDCGDDLHIQAEHGSKTDGSSIFSHSVVGHALEYKQTVFDDSVDFTSARSLQGVSAFVASPVFDPDGNVIACLFGARDVKVIQQHSAGIRPLEAQLVQVIAGIVGSRLARLSAEAEQTRTQVQLEQFASPQLVREMQSNPQWLEAQQRELTIMFGDIRGFSKLGLRLSADQIYSFVRDVMECMTHVIHDHGGFVFNFAGDGIAAMWNAPGRSDTHALDACRAAVEIQRALAEVDRQWSGRIGRSVKVGLGIHTGNALVGNSGSRLRLQYSPLGHEVNLASRIEGATKHFDVPILVSNSTVKLLDDEFHVRDLGEIVVVGIEQPTRVFQLATEDNLQQKQQWLDYNQAMEHFESGEHALAIERIEQILKIDPNDGPTRVLRKRISGANGAISPWVLADK